MRYSAAEKLGIIQLVGQSNLPQRRCLASLGVPRQTFYRWYDRYLGGGPEALADKPSRPDRIWNRIPDPAQGLIIDPALKVPELSPRELAVRFTDQEIHRMVCAPEITVSTIRALRPTQARRKASLRHILASATTHPYAYFGLRPISSRQAREPSRTRQGRENRKILKNNHFL